MTVVINGAGSAGCAIARMLIKLGVDNVILVDKNGIININKESTMVHKNDSGTGEHENLAKITNRDNLSGELVDAVRGADAFIGVSKSGLLTPEMIKTMADKPIIFAMANPTPEIMPDIAKEAGAFIIGTGRSDFPNQVNNVLCFPGIFKGAIAANAREITDKMKLAVVYALAGCVKPNQLSTEFILPAALEKETYVNAIAEAAMKAAPRERVFETLSSGIVVPSQEIVGTNNEIAVPGRF